MTVWNSLEHDADQPRDKVRFTVPAATNAAWTIIDLVDFQDERHRHE